MRARSLAVWVVALSAVGSFAQTSPNPLFTPTEGDPFGSSFYTAPGTRTLPSGAEVPPPVPEALLGPGKSLCRETFWLSADFLYAASSRSLLPPLVTAAPANIDPALAGRLGQPSTTVAFGGSQLSELRPALRAEAGVRIGERLGADATFVYTDSARASFEGTGRPGGTILARPIVFSGVETATLLGVLQPGSISATASSRLIGGDVNLRWNLERAQFGRWDVFAGYRYMNLRDEVKVFTDRLAPAPADGPDLRVTDMDLFRTMNQFHGPQVGIVTTQRLFDRLTFTARLGVALGVTLADTQLSGSTSSVLGTSATGLLVTGTNAGRYQSTYFAVLPTADAKFGYDVTDWLRLNVGYSFLYWSRVERAGDQIDRNVTGGRPLLPHTTTDYWLQGVTLGAEVRY